MSDYRVKGTDLASVADAIRTKGGTSAGLSFPDGFVSAVQNIPTGGGSTLITKNISANGTYNASSDSADGYSSVTVAVPNRLVIGTFTPATTDKGSSFDISIPYSGSGYPISLLIYPAVGTHKSGTDIYSLVQKNVIVMFVTAKADTSTAPDYTDNVEKNQGTAIAFYKNSDSDPTQTSASKSDAARAYNASGASSTNTNVARFKNDTTLSVYVADTSYGFKDGIEYTYEIVYSS